MFSLSKYLVYDVFVLNVTYKICEHFKVLVTRMDVNARIRRKSRDSDGLDQKIERNVYVNQQIFVSDIQLLIKH